jgi:transposase
MEGILPELRWCDKERLFKALRFCGEAKRKPRLLMIVNLVNGRSPTVIAAVLQMHPSTVYRVAKRFRELGLPGLCDGRSQNGPRKITDKYLSILHDVVAGSPPDHGWRRPTWTRELLVATLFTKTRIKIHVATMSVLLHRLGARRGRPKPTVRCPWPESRKQRRLREIERLVAELPENEVAVYEDEVDIHLNPKIGWDWMLRGQQKEVVTPGRNFKRYLAGAVDVRTRKLIWVEGDRKTGAMFVKLLSKLVAHYRHTTLIHVILDNYCIHSTSLVAMVLNSAAGHKIRLHFLPPYCPDDNLLERAWVDLHANVTRNHRCATIEQLMENIRKYLIQRNRVALHPTVAA